MAWVARGGGGGGVPSVLTQLLVVAVSV
eukprot:COSAG01_NODE_4381_length_5082_cov_57.158539_13_plen_27_part_01